MDKLGLKIIIGLGNPQPQYDLTPHNIGKSFVQWFFDESIKNGDIKAYKSWTLKNNLKAKVAEIQAYGTKIVVGIPIVYMNENGMAVAKLLNYYKVKPNDLMIIHDDTDLLIGNHKICYNHSSAGHKGVQSVIEQVKTQKFWRIKIGVRPPDKEDSVYSLKAGNFVLEKISVQNQKKLIDTFPLIYQKLWHWIKEC